MAEARVRLNREPLGGTHSVRHAHLDIRSAFLVLLDINGYTRFTTAHRVSMLHAEQIIAELLETVISKSTHPLVVHELLGDAVTFYVAAEGTAEVALEVRRQVAAIFDAFRAREGELISECACTPARLAPAWES